MRVAAGCALVVLSASALAQEATGEIRGRLRSSDRVPIAGATLTATSPDMLGARRATSASDGVFYFRALPPGMYTIQVTAIGHRPAVIDSVWVQLGRTLGLPDTELKATVVQLSEVRIASPRVTLDPARTTIGITLEESELRALPSDRDYKSLITIVPHVNTSYYAGDAANSAGSTGLENMYFIDGVNVTSPLNASGGTSLPYNFVRAVEVRAGGYEARYGRALGAVVNAVTYTGTNDFEAAAFGFFTNDGLTATAKTLPFLKEAGARSYDVGFRLSGPLRRDLLWFSAAWNPRRDQVDKAIPGLATHSEEETAQNYAGKLTWHPAPATRLELSVFGDPARRDQVNDHGFGAQRPLSAAPYLAQVETGGTTTSLKVTSTIGEPVLLEASVSRFRGRDNIRSPRNSGELRTLIVDYVDNTIDGNLNVLMHGQERRTGALHTSLAWGRHTAGLGVEYEDSRVDKSFRTIGNGFLLRTDSASFLEFDQRGGGAIHNRIATAWLQDSWRANARLTVNAGLRWSRQLFIGESGRVAQRLADEWQPRLGVSWQLDEAGAQRVFGSYGRFYQQEPLNFASLVYMDNLYVMRTYESDPRLGAVPLQVDTLLLTESTFANTIDGLPADHLDEFSAGYERVVGASTRVAVRGWHRKLSGTIQFGVDSTGQATIGTPGRGDFSFLPAPLREYTALEIGADGAWRQLRYRASYVLSRTWGNYSGLYNSDNENANPGENAELTMPHQANNSLGRLPNDRTHVGKLVLTWVHQAGLAAGAFFTVQSGTPLNEFGAGPAGPFFPVFLKPRGSVGRTPAIWDLNLRLSYEAPWVRGNRARVTIDIRHVGNPRAVVGRDQQRFFGVDDEGNPAEPNPGYLSPTGYQPPMSVRLGIELSRSR